MAGNSATGFETLILGQQLNSNSLFERCFYETCLPKLGWKRIRGIQEANIHDLNISNNKVLSIVSLYDET